jgi:hypothetical protein
MKKKPAIKISFVILLLGIIFPYPVGAWTEHPLLLNKALKGLPIWTKMDSVETRSLRSFLIDTEKELVTFLADQEKWSQANLPNYAKCPEILVFKATGNPDDILNRFYSAIRINPNAKIPLYLHLLPDQNAGTRPVAQPADITTMKDISLMIHTTYVYIREGESVSPFDVLITASDEPDYGFDLGLFEDNKTAYGKQYGFGDQPFGNPNLEYGSQAPFHMGFYHEAAILYKFGAFLKQTHLDYRIFLYKALSEFAFSHHQPYWGWRFMGWGMHYMGEVSMPYHMKPLPGVSTLRMMWINLKSMLGMPRAQKKAVQLVSNRHAVMEDFQQQSMRKAYLEHNNSFPLFQALENPLPMVPFSYDFLIHVASDHSANNAKTIDRALKKNMPRVLVSDPAVEANDRAETKKILEVMTQEKGPESVQNMTAALSVQMQQFSRDMHSFMEAVLNNK